MPDLDVDVPTPDGSASSSLHVPDGEGPWPAVIMYPDAGGTRGVFREMGGRLASDGYVVLVPDVFYRDELRGLAADDPALDLELTLTRERSPAWTGRRGRVDRTLLEELAIAAADRPHAFVCGPTAFVEAVADALVDLGHAAELVRTERFGPSGA